MQQQMWPLKDLAQRVIPEIPSTIASPAPAASKSDDEDMDMAAAFAAIHRKALEVGLYAA
jgi:hypothetical protein